MMALCLRWMEVCSLDSLAIKFPSPMLDVIYLINLSFLAFLKCLLYMCNILWLTAANMAFLMCAITWLWFMMSTSFSRECTQPDLNLGTLQFNLLCLSTSSSCLLLKMSCNYGSGFI